MHLTLYRISSSCFIFVFHHYATRAEGYIQGIECIYILFMTPLRLMCVVQHPMSSIAALVCAGAIDFAASLYPIYACISLFIRCFVPATTSLSCLCRQDVVYTSDLIAELINIIIGSANFNAQSMRVGNIYAVETME